MILYMDTQQLKTYFAYNPTDGSLTHRLPSKGRGAKKPGDTAGTLQPNGYLQVMVNRKRYYVHRLIWQYHYGTTPETIEHINGDKTDNRVENLREVTRKTIAQSRDSRNVYWTPHGYAVRFIRNGERIDLGKYPTQEEADKVAQEFRHAH